jgi:hypothetical protein
LLKQYRPWRNAISRAELIGAVFEQPPGCFRASQAGSRSL